MTSLFRIVAVFVAVGIVTPTALGQGLCCMMGGTCADVPDEPACDAMGGTYFEGASCAIEGCIGACCQDLDCVGEFPAHDCITSGRTFAGLGTTCLEDPCDAGVGACCLDGGACQDISPEDCGAMGGAWLGAGTNCGQGVCDPGACCLPGECRENLQHECAAVGGVFATGATCATDPCASDEEDCDADSLYGQSRDAPQFASVYTSEESAGFIRWDRFQGVPGAIEGVTWWGLELDFIPPNQFVLCSEPDPTFDITFYADAGGAPGAAVCTYTLTVPPTPTGVNYFGFDLLRYDVDLPAPCTLVNGWISIVGLGDPECWFLWLGAREGDGFSLCQGCIGSVEGDDLAFCLLGSAGGVFGACCDDAAGTCVENVEMNQCAGPGQRFVPDGTCGNLDPPCGVLEGACCIEADASCTLELEEDCATLGGLWLGAFTLCDQCPCVVPCPDGASLEGEPDCGDGYVDLFNGGCGVNEAFSPIAAGETVCGTNGVFLGNSGENEPDSDWYQFNVNNETELIWTVVAEFRPLTAILSAPYPGTVIAADVALECEVLTISASVSEGTYWLIVQASSNTDSAICPSPYTATLTVVVPCPGDTDGDGDVDVDDLQNVIADWGTDGSAHGGDITGPVAGSGPDGTVDVNDLNAVVAGWGPCPAAAHGVGPDVGPGIEIGESIRAFYPNPGSVLR